MQLHVLRGFNPCCDARVFVALLTCYIMGVYELYFINGTICTLHGMRSQDAAQTEVGLIIKVFKRLGRNSLSEP